MQTITIRPEQLADHAACEALVRDAFWDVYSPGCSEHLILHRARTSPDFHPELCLVAADGRGLVGMGLATRARVMGETRSRGVLCIGPLAVRPDRQRTGVGGALLRALLERGAALGLPAAFLYGSPGYYPRFGFDDARRWGVTTADGQNCDAFMGVELAPNGLDGVTGRFVESHVFEVDPDELDEFERRFPPREKHVLPGQLR